MTTPKSIEEQIEEAARIQSCIYDMRNNATSLDKCLNLVSYNTFKFGADLGRELERKRILDLLRSEEAVHSGINREGKIEQTLESKPVGPWIMSAALWADWLEEKINESVETSK